MKKNIISTVLITSLMISSVCGCANEEEPVSTVSSTDASSSASETEESVTEESAEDITDEAVAAADSFASAVVSCDLASMEAVCDDGYTDMWNEWRCYLDFEADDCILTEDQYTAICAIRDTLTYSIDEGSVEVSYDQVYVDITFYIADYDTAYEDCATPTIDEFLTELESADTLEMEVTLCLREEDGELLCCNYRRTLNMLYEFILSDMSFEHPIGEHVTGEIEWRYASSETDGHACYEDPVDIHASLETDDSYEDGMDGVRCEVTYEGEIVFTSYDSRYCVLYSGMVDPEDLAGRGYLLPAGEYEFTFYDEDDNILASDTCTVVLTGYRPQVHMEWTDFDSSFLEETDMRNMTAISVELYIGNVGVAVEEFTAEISYNGEVFYSETLTGNVRVFIRAGADPYYPDDSTGEYFAAGEYTVTFYDEWGNIYGSDTRTIS